MTDAQPLPASAETPSVPTFKRKKRPQATRSSLLRGDTPAESSDTSTREQTPLSGFEGDVDDSTRCAFCGHRHLCALCAGREADEILPFCVQPCSETLEELLALRRLKRSTAGLELDRLNSGERKKRPKPTKISEGGEEGVVVTSSGMLEGTGGGLRAGAGDRIRDDRYADQGAKDPGRTEIAR